MSPEPHRSLPFVRRLMIPAICCSLIGCGDSTTTLSIESPSGSHSEMETVKEVPSNTQVTADPIQKPPADATIVENSESLSQPMATDTSAMPALKPKLTMVDPARIIGSWRDSFFGTRTLTLNGDGTAHMRLDFDFAGSLLYGNRLDFDMKWKLEEGVVTIDIIDGHPAKAAKSAIATWGKRYVYLLDHVEANKVEMREGTQATRYTLARLPDSASRE